MAIQHTLAAVRSAFDHAGNAGPLREPELELS
jgi:hypothetical protein